MQYNKVLPQMYLQSAVGTLEGEHGICLEKLGLSQGSPPLS